MDFEYDFMTLSPNGKATIHRGRFMDFLAKQGYRCFNDKGSISIVQIRDNIIYQDPPDIFSKKMAELFKSNDSHQELFFEKAGSYIGAEKLKFLPSFEEFLLTDTKGACYIPFKNKIVHITKDKIRTCRFDAILSDTKLLYKDDIIDFDINLTGSYSKGDFAEFAKNAVTIEGLDSLMSSLGYLIHKYKDPALAKLVVFTDIHDTNSMYANGGTGKSLIAKDALKHIRNTSNIDGKAFKETDKHKFQNVSERNDIVTIEDLLKGTDLGIFFNACTGDFQIEEKFKKANVIPFSKSPKIAITANQGIEVRGTSEERRICMVGFSNYYNKAYTPMQQFNKRFFSSEWSDSDWNDFYNFMFACVQKYLSIGLQDYGFSQVQHKALIQKYGIDLYNTVKVNQEKLSVFHTKNIVISEFDSDFRNPKASAIDKYQSIKDIMQELGWTAVACTLTSYNEWALPDAEGRSHSLGVLSPQKRQGFIYKKEG